MIRLKTAEAKRDRLALYAILLLSLLLNSYGLDWGLTGLPRPYASVHPDEDFCFAPGFSFLRGQVTADVFFWGGTFFQMAMAATLGVARLCGSSPTTEWVHGLFVMTRLGVAINGVFNVFLVSLLGQRLGRRWVPDASEEVGLWGAAFFAVMPAPVALAHHIRPDVMLVTGILLVALMAERLMGPPPGVWPRQPDAENLIRQGTTVVSGIGHASAAVTSQPGARSSHTWWPCLLAGGSLGFTTAVRLNGAFCAPGLAVALMLNPQEKAKTRRLILMLAVALAVFAALSPFSLIYGPDLIGFYPAMKRAPFLDAYHRGPVLWQYATRVMWHGVGPALLVASYVGLALACWRRSQADVFVAAFVAPLAVSTGMSNLIYVRYLLPVLPFLAILAACAFVGAGTRARLRQAARAGVFGLSLLLCVAADSLFSQNDTRLAA
ncbi:MAG: hypothetical protein FJ272_15355, partial [Planctomycetes bacterium]|nr:hypothetical protein [Planctomycetota bacterium]